MKRTFKDIIAPLSSIRKFVYVQQFLNARFTMCLSKPTFRRLSRCKKMTVSDCSSCHLLVVISLSIFNGQKGTIELVQQWLSFFEHVGHLLGEIDWSPILDLWTRAIICSRNSSLVGKVHSSCSQGSYKKSAKNKNVIHGEDESSYGPHSWQPIAECL